MPKGSTQALQQQLEFSPQPVTLSALKCTEKMNNRKNKRHRKFQQEGKDKKIMQMKIVGILVSKYYYYIQLYTDLYLVRMIDTIIHVK